MPKILVVASTYVAFETWYVNNRSTKYDQHIWVPRADYLRGVSSNDSKLVYTSCARSHPEYEAIKAAAELIGL